jgi:hypothetical protein
MMNDQDFRSRQAALMTERIESYSEGRQSLNQLTYDLEALAIAASILEPSWRARFQKAWALLEELNAVLLDEGGRPPSPHELELLDDALTRLTALAAELKTRG